MTGWQFVTVVLGLATCLTVYGIMKHVMAAWAIRGGWSPSSGADE